MKTKIGVILLAVVSVGLIVALIAQSRQAAEEKKKDADRIYDLSNKVVKADIDLSEQRQVNLILTNDLGAAKTNFTNLTNKFVEVSASLAKTTDALEAAKKEITDRENKIADLEQQNRDLDKRADDLTNSITKLSTQIADTERKLAEANSDKEFLGKELKRLMGEKAELERQFNDITVLRAQVAKLREELNISRRLEWIRKGLFAVSEQKGAQQLIQHEAPGASPPQVGHYDLNVEVNADGSVRVLPPATNSPAAPK